MAVRYWESTMRRSSSRARGSGAAERSMAAPEVQKADQCFSAAAKVAEGSAGVWLARWKPQQKARRSVAGGGTKRGAGPSWEAAAAPGQAVRGFAQPIEGLLLAVTRCGVAHFAAEGVEFGEAEIGRPFAGGVGRGVPAPLRLRAQGHLGFVGLGKSL